jgi:hypothetical protein
MVAVLQAHERKQRAYEQQHGKVRPIISTEFAGHRVVAVGQKLMWAKQFKVFPDFLNHYLHSALNNHWGEKQVALALAEQHPIVQWRTIWTTKQQGQRPDADGLYTERSGAGLAWYRLAYDLYLLEHHDELQNKLLRRLRDVSAFQGARLEIVAAAVMLPAGYELAFENDKLPGKHAEFVATNKQSGSKLAVEAKSRHRPGVMGQKGERVTPEKADIGALLKAAVEKDPKEPLLVFIELNMPILMADGKPLPQLVDELQQSWKEVQDEQWPNGFPAVGVIFYNDAATWFLEEIPEQSAEVFVLAMWPERHRHVFDEKKLLPLIMTATYQRLTIPKEFPG